MKAARLVLVFVALAAGAAGGGAPALEADGTRQCYRRGDEPLDACNICADTCLGGIYKCCDIVT